jgi:hypothetical protein
MTIFGELVSLPSNRPIIFNLLQTNPSRKNVDTNMRTRTWKFLAVMKKMDSYGKVGEFRKLSVVIRKSVFP